MSVSKDGRRFRTSGTAPEGEDTGPDEFVCWKPALRRADSNKLRRIALRRLAKKVAATICRRRSTGCGSRGLASCSSEVPSNLCRACSCALLNAAGLRSSTYTN